MDAPIIDVTFGPSVGDRTTLSKATRRTLEALFRHPIAHNLEWADVVALFKVLGTVDHRANDEVVFCIDGTDHRLRRPHSKDISVDELLAFRRILTQAGWSVAPRDEAGSPGTPAQAEHAVDPTLPDLLVTVEHHEARIYHLDLQSIQPLDQVIKPYDPHHFLHHLTHKDLSRAPGQRAPEDPSFYRRLGVALEAAHRIVVLGSGAGHSNAADRLLEFLRIHHPATFQKVICEVAADLSNLTPPQLLVLGRRALSRGTDK